MPVATILIGHRGAAGYRPEHTLASYKLAELTTLTAVERLPHIRQHNTLFNGRYGIPTFQELLDLRAWLSDELHRELGVYPETKHPTFFSDTGVALEPRLLEILRRNRLNRPDAPVFVQSFEVTNLQRLREAGLRTKSVQLLAASGMPFDTVAAGSGPTYAELSNPGRPARHRPLRPGNRARQAPGHPPHGRRHARPRHRTGDRRPSRRPGRAPFRSPTSEPGSTVCSPTRPTPASSPAPPRGSDRLTSRRRRTPGLTR
ncbi:MAG: hypothetical protein ACRDRW_17390 [Pseudonocardiaceae bacterium]